MSDDIACAWAMRWMSIVGEEVWERDIYVAVSSGEGGFVGFSSCGMGEEVCECG